MVDGCVFHACFEHSAHPDSRVSQRKRQIDRLVNEKLVELGYRVERIWQHEVDENAFLEANFQAVLDRLI